MVTLENGNENMLTSSPYTINDAFHLTRTKNQESSPFHPATRSRITLMECLEARGYDGVYELHWPTKVALQWDLAQKKMTTEIKWLAKDAEQDEMVTQMLTDCDLDDLLFIAYTNKSKNVCCVFWPLKPYTKSQMDEIAITYLQPKKINNIIVVSEQPVKAQCSVVFQHRGIECTFFSYDDLKFNITQHILVPKYKVVPHDQLPSNIKPVDIYRLPTLLKTDPVCVFYGWCVGTVLQIESLTGKPEPEYRIVRSDHTWHPARPTVSALVPTPIPKHTTFQRSLQPRQQHNIREFLKV